jgi:putative flippase GtrA
VLAAGAIAVFGNASAARRLAAVMSAMRPTPPRKRRELAALLARHQAGALIATVVDFSTMVACVQTAGIDPVPATSIGAACGAITNFIVSRTWIFEARTSSAAPQALRYVLVSGASLVLNTFGQWLLHTELGVQYVVARLVVAVLVSVAWNFPMHRAFVFARARSQ